MLLAVNVTPDGRWAVSGSEGSDKMRVWDLESGRELQTLFGHRGFVVAVAVTPDGGRTVSASGDGTLKVWELQTGRELQTFSSHAGGVNAVVVMPDGQRAISASKRSRSASKSRLGGRGASFSSPPASNRSDMD